MEPLGGSRPFHYLTLACRMCSSGSLSSRGSFGALRTRRSSHTPRAPRRARVSNNCLPHGLRTALHKPAPRGAPTAATRPVPPRAGPLPTRRGGRRGPRARGPAVLARRHPPRTPLTARPPLQPSWNKKYDYSLTPNRHKCNSALGGGK